MPHTGIHTIGEVPWGTHFCQFYEDKQDLIDILVPYFKAGLENNEFCMWVTAEPLRVEEARNVLACEIPNLEDYLGKGQIDILDYSQWYTAGGRFESDRVLQGWVARLETALNRGFAGLRLTGNTFWLEKSEWQDFTEYEAAVDRVIGRHRMMALCTYSLARCGAAEIMDVVANHAFALVKRTGQWQVIESAERKRAEASLRASEQRYSSLFEQMTEGFALHEIICDENGTPCDYRFLEINPAFERLTGLKRADLVGRTMREVLPGDDPKWIEVYGAVALTGKPVRFDNYSPELKRHYDVLAYQPAPRQFAVLFTDITDRNRAEQAVREREEEVAAIYTNAPLVMMVVDGERRVRKANKAAEQFAGSPEAVLLGRRGGEALQCLHALADPGGCGFGPDCARCTVRRTVLDTLETGRGRQQVEVTLPFLREGQARDITFLLSTARLSVRGEPRALVTLQDITAHKRAEQSLRESDAKRAVAEALDVERRRLNEILDRLPTMVCLMTPDYHIPFANRLFRETFGEPQGRTCYNYIFDRAEPCPQCESMIPLRTGRPHRWVNPCPGGRLVESHDFPFTDVDGAPMILEVDVDITERSRMEKELSTASRYVRSLIEASLDPLVTISPEGKITDVNHATELVTGLPRERLVGTRFSDYFTEPGRAEQGYHKVLSDGLVRDYALTISHADGHTTDVVYNASLYRNEAGEVQGVFAAARDVTERKRIEEQLRAASLYARSLIEASLDPLVTISPKGKITDVNEATEQVTGVPRRALIGSDFSDYFTEPGRARAGYRKVLSDGLVRDYPLTIRHAAGHTTDVLYNAVVYRNEAGQVQGVFAAARDVTERKRMEEQLRAASLYSRSLIEASLDPLVTISPEGKITDVNEATEQVTGVPRRGLIGRDFSDYFTEPDRARAGYRKVLSDGLVRDYPLTIRHAAGQTTDVLYNAVVYRGEAGRVQGVFAAARDITERKRAEAELERYRGHLEELVQQRTGELQTANAHLRRTTAELARSNQELEQFAYVASHDLQEPLRAVTGYLGLIEQQFGEKLDDRGRHFITGAVQGAARMHTLITDLLALSRVGTRGEDFKPADLNTVLGQALDGLGASIQETGATITRDPLPTLRVDAIQIAQLFQNLVGNAIKFRRERPPEICISAEPKPGHWVVRVRDNGIGIEPQYFERIFLIFQRLHTRTKYPGTGIGLAICKKIVERHGGTLWVESQPGQGSTFCFTIPD